MFIDLHTHSNYSLCGKQTTDDIVISAKENGIKILSLTDHDTTEGITEIIKIGKENNIIVVPGIEISTTTKEDIPFFEIDSKIHILGYNIDYQNTIINQLPSKGKQSTNWLSPKNAVLFIKQIGGIPIIAHPFRKTETESYSKEQVYQLIKYLKTIGLQGVEAYHYSNAFDNKIQELTKFCKTENLVITMGSDRHRKQSAYYGKYFSKQLEPFINDFDSTEILKLLCIK